MASTPVSQHTGLAGVTAVDQKGAAGYTVLSQHAVAVPPPTGVSAHSGVTDPNAYTEIAQK